MDMRIGARRAVVATCALVSLVNFASAADDAGVRAFFSNAFGQAGQAAPAVAAPSSEPAFRPNIRRRAAIDRAPTVVRHFASYRPLTVRRQAPKTEVATGPSVAAPIKVSIYNDPTMRAGDAVMTSDGIRVFAGSRSWPYAKSDFVTIAEARDLSHDTVKVLAGLNSAPRS